MNTGQRFIQWLLPRSLFDALRRGTRSFIIECRCGHQRDLWDAGGVKGAGNQKSTLAKCPQCGKLRWHKKRKKTAEELQLFPIEVHPDGSLEFSSRRDGWATIVVWGSALLIWGSGVLVMALYSDQVNGAIVINLAILVGLIGPWFWVTTSYRLSCSDLRLQSGCFSKVLMLSEIRRVKQVRGGIGINFAFSLDTLCINILGNRLGYRISPQKQAAFLDALTERCPHLCRVGDELTAGDSIQKKQ
jgi:Bacterial PH domain